MAFTNEITGGQGALVRPAIKSPNFATGVSGWSINRDGSAEFNNLTLRGTFNGTDYTINSLGAFFYSGAPAHGNLIASIASVAGTDAHGNAYPAGIMNQLGSANGDAFTLMQNGSLFVGQNAGGVQDIAHAASVAIDAPATDLLINSPVTVGQPNAAVIELSSSSGTPSVSVTGNVAAVGTINPLVTGHAQSTASATVTTTGYGAASVALSATAVLPASGKALVSFLVRCMCSVNGDNVLSDLTITGSSSGTFHTAGDATAIQWNENTSAGPFETRQSISGVAGETVTATAQHRVNTAGTTGTFLYRDITIQTLPV